MHIELSVNGQLLKKEPGPIIVSGSKYYLTAHVDFLSSDWDGALVTLRIEQSGNVNGYLLNNDNCVTEDSNISLNAGDYEISLIGIRNKTEITTNKVILNVLSSGIEEGNALPEIPDTMAVQLIKAVQQAVSTANSVRSDADNGKFNGQDGESATHSWDGTVLTITSASGTSSADLRGPQGPEGKQGPQGQAGKDAPQDAVRYGVQALDEAQKETARGNIGAASAGEVSRVKDDINAVLKAQHPILVKSVVSLSANNTVKVNVEFIEGEKYVIDISGSVGILRADIYMKSYTEDSMYGQIAFDKGVTSYPITARYDYPFLQLYTTIDDSADEHIIDIKVKKYNSIVDIEKNNAQFESDIAELNKQSDEIKSSIEISSYTISLNDSKNSKIEFESAWTSGDTFVCAIDSYTGSNLNYARVFGMRADGTYDSLGTISDEFGKLYELTCKDDYAKIRVYVESTVAETCIANIRFSPVEDTLVFNVMKNENRISALESSFGEFSKYRILVLGDSYSGMGYWVNGMKNELGAERVQSLVNLGVGSCTVRDRYSDRETYPYTDRPVSTANTGNLNTLSSQVLKLKRLMSGTDLDSGESAIYQTEAEYPNIIIIEGGMNETPDSDNKVATYYQQFITKKTDVYWKRDSVVSQGTFYVKTPAEEVDRTCFAGSYRHVVEELSTLFPDAQFFITTASRMGYWTYDINERRDKTAEQQRRCAALCGATVIDWNAEGNINTIMNFPSGSGTVDDPYTDRIDNPDTSDGMHPNSARGGVKYGRLAAKVIRQRFINILNE